MIVDSDKSSREVFTFDLQTEQPDFSLDFLVRRGLLQAWDSSGIFFDLARHGARELGTLVFVLIRDFDLEAGGIEENYFSFKLEDSDAWGDCSSFAVPCSCSHFVGTENLQ